MSTGPTQDEGVDSEQAGGRGSYLRLLVDGRLSMDNGVHKETRFASRKNRTGHNQVDCPARVEIYRVAIDLYGTG